MTTSVIYAQGYALSEPVSQTILLNQFIAFIPPFLPFLFPPLFSLPRGLADQGSSLASLLADAKRASIPSRARVILFPLLVIYIPFLVIHSCIQISIPTVFHVIYPITFSFLIAYWTGRYPDIVARYIYKFMYVREPQSDNRLQILFSRVLTHFVVLAQSRPIRHL